MQMTNDEIVMRYRQAKIKGDQVQILAELNGCPVERIIGILTSAGIDNRNFNRLRAMLEKHEPQKEQAEAEEQPEADEIPKSDPLLPMKEHTAEIPKAVIAAVEDKITELQYMIEQNKEQAKSLLQHNEKFNARIDILNTWLKEVKKL